MTLGTCCNTFSPVLVLQINVFMGIGLLSCPYAMRLSGWAGLLALAGAACLFCLSGKLIVAGFKKIPGNMPQTYPALGERSRLRCLCLCVQGNVHPSAVEARCYVRCSGQAAMGGIGRGLVVTLAVMEFFGASCMVRSLRLAPACCGAGQGCTFCAVWSHVFLAHRTCWCCVGNHSDLEDIS